MNFSELAKNRYSLRKFSDKKVLKADLDKILNTVKEAPSAVNYQPHRILVIESERGIEKIKNCTKYHFDAPMFLVLCYDNSKSWKRKQDNKDMGEIDASIAGTYIMLSAVENGLGTTWVGYFDCEAVRREFKLPENIIPVAIFPLGYPADDAKPAPKHFERFDLSETVFYENF